MLCVFEVFFPSHIELSAHIFASNYCCVRCHRWCGVGLAGLWVKQSEKNFILLPAKFFISRYHIINFSSLWSVGMTVANEQNFLLTRGHKFWLWSCMEVKSFSRRYVYVFLLLYSVGKQLEKSSTNLTYAQLATVNWALWRWQWDSVGVTSFVHSLCSDNSIKSMGGGLRYADPDPCDEITRCPCHSPCHHHQPSTLVDQSVDWIKFPLNGRRASLTNLNCFLLASDQSHDSFSSEWNFNFSLHSCSLLSWVLAWLTQHCHHYKIEMKIMWKSATSRQQK